MSTLTKHGVRLRFLGSLMDMEEAGRQRLLQIETEDELDELRILAAAAGNRELLETIRTAIYNKEGRPAGAPW